MVHGKIGGKPRLALLGARIRIALGDNESRSAFLANN
jgi:hypothetical protein